MKLKYKITDIQIGDTIITTAGVKGEVVSLLSYSYLNDKFLRQQQYEKNNNEPLLLDLMPFKNDNIRHQGIWYQNLIISTCDPNAKKPVFHLEGVDISDIQNIIKPNSDIPIKKSFIETIKGWFQ